MDAEIVITTFSEVWPRIYWFVRRSSILSPSCNHLASHCRSQHPMDLRQWMTSRRRRQTLKLSLWMTYHTSYPITAGVHDARPLPQVRPHTILVWSLGKCRGVERMSGADAPWRLGHSDNPFWTQYHSLFYPICLVERRHAFGMLYYPCLTSESNAHVESGIHVSSWSSYACSHSGKA